MNQLAKIAALSALVATLACASSQTGGGVVPGQTRPTATGTKVVILAVPDGSERREGPAGGSGAAMTAALRDSLIQKGIAPLVSETDSLTGAFEQARDLDYDYVLKAVLTEWEDNATEWSGRPDSAALSAELYDANEATLVATATQREKGSSMAITSQTPERFLEEIADHVVAKLFGLPAPATR